jgi:hypothetical protein
LLQQFRPEPWSRTDISAIDRSAEAATVIVPLVGENVIAFEIKLRTIRLSIFELPSTTRLVELK